MAAQEVAQSVPDIPRVPVYVGGKLEGHIVGGKYVSLDGREEPPRVPYSERRLRYRNPEWEASVTCYFIGGEVGPVKIGQTENLDKRLRAIQAHSPVVVSVLASTGGGMFAEAAYHERFAAYRLHGEWFERVPEILAEIDRLNELAA